MGGGAKVAVDEYAQVTDSTDWFNGRKPATEMGQRESCDCRRADASPQFCRH